MSNFLKKILPKTKKQRHNEWLKKQTEQGKVINLIDREKENNGNKSK